MKNEKIYSRLEQIFTQDELSRFAITEKQSGVRIVVNVHGLKCFQVRQLLNNLISVLRMKFHLLVIHGYVTFSSAAFECLIDGVILIFEKNSEGTKIWKFNKTDWQNLGKECAKGFVIGGIRGAAVYTLSNFTIVPASVASVFVTISINLARDAYDLKEGRLNKAQFIQRNESNIIDVSCGAIGAGLGSKYIAGLLPAVMGSNIPAQIAGTIIGNGVGMLVSFFLKKWLIHKKTE